eukprot:6217956-Karenia_brevis.AAC.1
MLATVLQHFGYDACGVFAFAVSQLLKCELEFIHVEVVNFCGGIVVGRACARFGRVFIVLRLF